MVILGENPYAVPKDRLKEIPVEQLILNGKPYEKQSGSWVGMVIRGLFGSKKI